MYHIQVTKIDWIFYFSDSSCDESHAIQHEILQATEPCWFFWSLNLPLGSKKLVSFADWIIVASKSTPFSSALNMVRSICLSKTLQQKFYKPMLNSVVSMHIIRLWLSFPNQFLYFIRMVCENMQFTSEEPYIWLPPQRRAKRCLFDIRAVQH